MDEYKNRVIQEHDDLAAKLDKLRMFLLTKDCNNVSQQERELLMRQEDYMLRYLIVLEERMNLFGVRA